MPPGKFQAMTLGLLSRIPSHFFFLLLPFFGFISFPWTAGNVGTIWKRSKFLKKPKQPRNSPEKQCISCTFLVGCQLPSYKIGNRSVIGVLRGDLVATYVPNKTFVTGERVRFSCDSSYKWLVNAGGGYVSCKTNGLWNPDPAVSGGGACNCKSLPVVRYECACVKCERYKI